MTLHRAFAAAVLTVVAYTSAAAAPPLTAYGRLPAIEQVEISPDGKYLALISTTAEQRRILIRDAETLRTVTIINAGDQKVRDLQWAGSGHLLITTSATGLPLDVTAGPRAEYAVTTVYDIARNRQEPLMKGVQEKTMNVTIGEPQFRMVAGKPTVLLTGIQFVDTRGRLSLFSINLETGRAMIASQGEPNTQKFIVDDQGKASAQSIFDRQTGQWGVLVREGAGWKPASAGQAVGADLHLLGLARDGRSALVGIGDGSQRLLRELSPDGVWGPPLPYANVYGFLRDPVSQRLIGTFSRFGAETRYTFFDPADQAVWATIVRSYPGEQVELASWSGDRKRAVVRVESAAEGAAYAIVDLTARKATWLGGTYPEVEPQDIATVRPVRYKAADGLEITGYLTLPKGKEAKALPLIVLVHGGPAARDEPGFNWWAQALASRGYAVLQANFRGSQGFGPQFLTAGYGEWGKKMQTDLSDGVRHLGDEGLINPGRVCIAGASYGGYAALAGATLDKGVYRCAASIAGPSDLSKMLSYAQRYQGGDAAIRAWGRQMGVSGPQDPKLSAISPALLARSVDIPLLLIHGRDDNIVPFEQSRFMAEAMRQAGKPVELVSLDGEDHYLSRGDTRLKMLQSLVTFLERNNPPG